MFHCLALEDRNPHLKVRGLLEQHMLFSREQPHQIAAPNPVASVPQQVSPLAPCHQVQFQLNVRVTPVRVGRAAVAPHVSIQLRRQMQTLRHDKK